MAIPVGAASAWHRWLLSRQLALSAKEFNQYQAHDGLPDVLEARRNAGQLDRPAHERYSKHVKALVQVGQRRTDGYQTALGYPAELITLDNPYNSMPGSMLRIRALVGGQPVPNQLVGCGRPYGTAVDADGPLGRDSGPARVARVLVCEIHSHATCVRRHDSRL